MHRPRTCTNNSRWSLDEFVDDFIVYGQDARKSIEEHHSRQYSFSTVASDSPFAVHGTLSHHNSVASSASSRSTKSRSSIAESTRTTTTENTAVSLPVTIYEVPHSYDDNEDGRERDTRQRPPPTTQPQSRPYPQQQQHSSSSSSSLSTPSSPVTSSFQAVNPAAAAIRSLEISDKDVPHFVIAVTGTVDDEVRDVCQLLFPTSSSNGGSNFSWHVDHRTKSTVSIHRIPSTDIAALESLRQRMDITTIIMVVSLTRSIDHMYGLLDQLDQHLSLCDPEKTWWARLILIFNQTDTSHPNLIMDQRDTILNVVIPIVQARYGKPDNPPAVMFVTALPHLEPSPDYSLQCRRILYQLLLDNHLLGRERPLAVKSTRSIQHNNDDDDEDSDDDDDDLLSATVIQISPQGVTALDRPKSR